jgi:2OG-Fe(II) oxygenase superfamily
MTPEGVFVQEGFMNATAGVELVRLHENYAARTSQRAYSGEPALHFYDLVRIGTKPEVEALWRSSFYTLKAVEKAAQKELFFEAIFVAMLRIGGRHPLHRDNCKEDGSPNHTPNRVWSSIVYLADGFEGGELVFPGRGTLKPLGGMLVAFPSGHDYPHEVLPVTNGRRYTLAIWFTGDRTKSMFQ